MESIAVLHPGVCGMGSSFSAVAHINKNPPPRPTAASTIETAAPYLLPPLSYTQPGKNAIGGRLMAYDGMLATHIS